MLHVLSFKLCFAPQTDECTLKNGSQWSKEVLKTISFFLKMNSRGVNNQTANKYRFCFDISKQCRFLFTTQLRFYQIIKTYELE